MQLIGYAHHTITRKSDGTQINGVNLYLIDEFTDDRGTGMRYITNKGFPIFIRDDVAAACGLNAKCIGRQCKLNASFGSSSVESITWLS